MRHTEIEDIVLRPTLKRSSRFVAATTALIIASSLATISSSQAEPELGDVEQKVQRLYHEAEVAAEDYNEAREQLRKTQDLLRATQRDLRDQRQRTGRLRADVAASVVANYQGQALSSATQVVLSDDPDAFLEKLTTISAFDERQEALLVEFARQEKVLEMRSEATSRVRDEANEQVRRMKVTKATIDRAAAGARNELNRLEARERAALRAERAPSRSSSRATTVPEIAGSGRGPAAVRFALQQLGDRYVYGAAGPDEWDCSGLTMRAWEAAGVSLPHQSRMQMAQGTPVSLSDLRPGDLVAYYSPISHIGMYIGNGKLVHAANPSKPVEIVPVNSMPISGAVRVG